MVNGRQSATSVFLICLPNGVEIWCKNSAKSGRKATTYTNYKAYYMAHVKDTELGKKEIGKIRKMDCQRLFSEMIEKGSKKSTLNKMRYDDERPFLEISGFMRCRPSMDDDGKIQKSTLSRKNT